MLIRIENLRLRTIIGIYDWEREHKQDVVINVRLTFDGARAAETDQIDDTVNYKKITKRIIALVEAATCQLLERLADQILKSVMDDARVQEATVRIDKPGAVRFADSVSVETTAAR